MLRILVALIVCVATIVVGVNSASTDLLLLGSGPSAPGGGGATNFTDDFNRANGGIGSNYDEHENALSVDTNQYDSAVVGKGFSTVKTSVADYADDHSATILMTTTDSFDRAGPGVRGTSTCGYVCYANGTNLVIDEYSGSSTWAFGA